MSNIARDRTLLHLYWIQSLQHASRMAWWYLASITIASDTGEEDLECMDFTSTSLWVGAALRDTGISANPRRAIDLSSHPL